MEGRKRNYHSSRKHSKNANVKMLIILFASIILFAFMMFVFVINHWSVTIVLNGSDNVTVEYGSEYQDEGVDARLQGSLIFKKGFPIHYTIDGGEDLSELGEVTRVYSAQFMGMSHNVTRTIHVVDTQAPEILLITVEGNYTIPGEQYEEEGFGATDNYDGDITDKVIREEKDGIVTYCVTDSSGNVAKVTRTILYNDPIAPELVLKGDNIITLLVGTEYEELGYTATDNCDGDITDRVIVSGEIDSDCVGEYILIYTITDTFGNKDVAQRIICYVDTEAPQIIFDGGSDITHEVGTAYQDNYTATDNYDGDLTEQVVVNGRVNPNKIGTYTITYEVKDSSGNVATAIKTVHVQDSIAPELILKGEENLVIQVGGTYTEAGYTANDNYDGNLTSEVKVSGSVDIKKPGIYVITYSVSDSSGNTTKLQRVVNCYDPVPPTLTLKGSKNITINAGTTYTEPGYTATDNYDGNITSSVKINGNVNVYHAGTYTITYSITDSSGNTVTDTRTVTVNAIRQPDTVTPSGKVIYLTFDDGPGKYTKTLLSILEKYNVKASFFVVNTSFSDTISDIASAGHTVALHTFTHDYSKVYASEEAYFEDLKNIQALVYKKTGILSTMVRFPGGSSNKVSAKYCTGIMTSLTKALDSMGYQYYDWNVGSEDTGGAKTSEEVFQNVIEGVQKHDISIVLQHDIYEYSVNAVEKIIIWGLENGYTFLPLDETSPKSHQKVAN